MSLVRPKGVPVTIGGQAFSLLFSLGAICEIEEHYDKPLVDVIRMLGEVKNVYPVLLYLTAQLVGDDVMSRNFLQGKDEHVPTQTELGMAISLEETGELSKAILTAYGLSFPEAEEEDEDEDPNLTRRSTSE